MPDIIIQREWIVHMNFTFQHDPTNLKITDLNQTMMKATCRIFTAYGLVDEISIT
jgi:hypothetical protein